MGREEDEGARAVRHVRVTLKTSGQLVKRIKSRKWASGAATAVAATTAAAVTAAATTAATATAATAIGAATTAATAAATVRAATAATAATAGATTTATVATTTAAAATAAAAAVAATRAVFTRTGLVDDDGAAFEGLAIHAVDGSLRFRVRAHLDEAEALRATRIAVHHDLGGRDGSELRKCLLKRIVAHGIRKVADVKFVSHREALDQVPKTTMWSFNPA